MRQGNGEEEEEKEKKKKKNTFGTAFTRSPQAVIYNTYIYQYTFTAATSSLVFCSISATADDGAE